VPITTSHKHLGVTFSKDHISISFKSWAITFFNCIVSWFE
jgi:hypothetical protein